MCVCVCVWDGGVGEVEAGVWRSSCGGEGGGGGNTIFEAALFCGGSILKMHKSNRTIIS